VFWFHKDSAPIVCGSVHILLLFSDDVESNDSWMGGVLTEVTEGLKAELVGSMEVSSKGGTIIKSFDAQRTLIDL
jgi:hypothetical protein